MPFPLALAAEGLDPAALVQSPFDLLSDGPDLAVVVPAADDEVVGDDEERRDVEDRDALGLLVRRGLSGLESPGPRFAPIGLCYGARRKSFPTTIVRSTIPCS